MPHNLARHFSFGGLVKYTSPSMAMMVIMSIYIIVDGFFVSNFVGSGALAAINFAFPIVLILGTFGYMIGAGGSALIAKTLGEGDKEKAHALFSFLVLFAVVLGVILTILGILLLPLILSAMGAEGKLLEDSIAYGSILMYVLLFDILQFSFQSFIMTAGKPKLGMVFTLAAGVTNALLDYICIAVLGWGLQGAALATVAGCAVGGIAPIIYFFSNNSSLLHFTKPRADAKQIFKALSNGSSEMVSNISMSVVTLVYDIQLLHYLGENGVAAYSIMGYVSLIFLGIFEGYITGVSPLFSFQFGAKNYRELRSLFKKSIYIVALLGIVMFVASRLLARPIALLFVGYDAELTDLTTDAFLVFSLAYLIIGFNLFGSGLFTALNNGLVSAILSFSHTFLFEITAIVLLPLYFGPFAIWYSAAVGELVSLAVVIFFVLWLGPRYGLFSRKMKKVEE